MTKVISSVFVDKGVAAAALVEETLTDGSKVYNITIGNHEVCCSNESRAAQSFVPIAKAIREAADGNVVII